MWYERLPHLNAFLNATSFVLLVCGYLAIRRKDQRTHARFMLAAFSTSTLFLMSYVTYHLNAGHKPYEAAGFLRYLYVSILVSHIILAITTLPLALVTLFFAWKKRFDRHRRIARWTFPIWVYVSVTGVVVYVMLYWFSSRPGIN